MPKQKHPRSSRQYPPGIAARNQVIFSYMRSAVKLKIPFELTYDECDSLFKKNCFYCNIVPNQKSWGSTLTGEYIYNGLDRKIPEKGYTIENVVTCCDKCNSAKGPLPFDQFVLYIERITKHAKI